MERLNAGNRRLICIFVCCLALLGSLPGAAAASSARFHGGETLLLSELLAQSEQCGPAYMRVHDFIALADLAERASQTHYRLTGTVEAGVGSDGFPAGFRQAALSARWPITDELTIAAEKNLLGTDGYVSATWSQVLWPQSASSIESDHMQDLELLHIRFQADRGVLVAFQQAKNAEREWVFAQENARIARERFDIASRRFEAGEMGLSMWRSEEEQLMQAEEQVRFAARQREDALWHLTEVLYGGCADAGSILPAAEHTYMDDLRWDAIVVAIMERLQLGPYPNADDSKDGMFLDIDALLAAADQDRIQALLERYDISAQQAWLQLRQKEQEAADAARQKLPKISGVAHATQPLSGGAALEWHAGVAVTMDWSGSAQLDVERARIERESAERELQATLRQVYRDGAQALERVREAQVNVMARKQATERAEEAARIVRLRVESGFLTQLDLAEAELAVARAAAQYERAMDELKLAWFDLALRFGMLPTDWLTQQK